MKESERPRVLIVVDDPISLKTLRKTLERESFEVVDADSIRKARLALRTGCYAVVLCDLVLPDGSGIQLIREIREEWPQVGIVVVTGVAEFSNLLDAVYWGASGYIQKPLRTGQIMNAVNDALSYHRTQSDPKPADTIGSTALIITSDPIEIRSLNNGFSRQGFSTVLAGTYEEAVGFLPLTSLDLIFLDAGLPGKRGLDLMREACRRVPETLVIVLADPGEVDTFLEASRGGVYDVLAKPLNKNLFVASIRRARMFIRARTDRGRLELSRAAFGQRLEKMTEDLNRQDKESVSRIRHLEAFSESILHSLPCGVVTTDLDRRITCSNPAAQQFLGVNGPGLEGTEFGLVAQLKTLEEALDWAMVRQIRSNRQIARVEDPELGTRTWGYGCGPLLNPMTGALEGGIVHFNEIIGDPFGNSPEVGLDIETMASSLAHEANNALSSVICQVELLGMSCAHSTSVDSQRVQQELGRISENLDRVTLLLREKIQGGKQRFEKKVVDLHETIQSVMKTMELLLVNGGIKTELCLKAEDARVESRSREIEQVLVNLIKNSRDAMPGGGTITVSTRNTQFSIEVEVKDTGTGMAPGEIPILLLPYQTTKPAGKGTGLGLPICQAILKRHGGNFLIESPEEGGARVRFSLPRIQTSVRVIQSCSEFPHFSSFSRPFRVALVDDEQPILDFCQVVLRQQGFETEAFRSPDEFLRRQDQAPFQVLITDIRMPDRSGLDLCEEMRRRYPETHLYLMTGSFSNVPPKWVLAPGKVNVLMKPFREADLLGLMWEALRQEGQNLEGSERTAS